MLAEQLRSRSDLVWAAFKARVQAQGGTVLELSGSATTSLIMFHVLRAMTATSSRAMCSKGEGFARPVPVVIPLLPGRTSKRVLKLWVGSCWSRSGLAQMSAIMSGVVTGTMHIRRRIMSKVEEESARLVPGHNPAAAAMNFRAQLAELGATLLEPYVDCMHPHHVLCANNHDCFPRPNNVKSGQGICDQCAGRVHDVFYLVTGPRGLKVGVTSGDPKDRLRDHRRDGYYEDGDPDRLWIKLPPKVANETEDLVLASLKAAGIKPIERREYFGIEALPVVLSIVDRELAWYTPVFGPGQEEGIKETQ